MTKEIISKAVKAINQGIRDYQRELTYQLELKAEAQLCNGNIVDPSLYYFKSNIEKYEIILADLATIRRTIKKNKTYLKIFGTKENRDYIYAETCEVLKNAGLNFVRSELEWEIVLIPTNK